MPVPIARPMAACGICGLRCWPAGKRSMATHSCYCVFSRILLRVPSLAIGPGCFSCVTIGLSPCSIIVNVLSRLPFACPPPGCFVLGA